MSSAKPVPLLGRLAIQMKLIDMQQLNAATDMQQLNAAERGRTSSSGEGKKIGEVLVDLGFINAAQLEKLIEVQRGVIAKHRARKAAASAQPGADVETAPPAEGSPTTSSGAAESVEEPQPAPQAAPPPLQPPSTPHPPRSRLVAEPVDGDTESLLLSTVVPSEEDTRSLHRLLQHAVSQGSSDIHIHTGAAARIRINGVLTQVGSETLSAEDTEAMVMAILSESERLELLQYGELDVCLDVPGLGRFRTSVYRQLRGFDAVLRTIPPEPPTLDQLGLPSWIAKYVNYHQGMVLITGPAGCGKSATMAAMVNLINEERQEHILCIEDPIEVVHPSKGCLVNQRHAGRHTGSFARALRAALREDPDVIVIGELRDLETISLAMTAAETGHFVLATLHTNNAVRTINRMIGAFPSNQQGQVRTMLSESLRAVISQRLVPTADESGRIAAFELLVINKAIANLVRDEKTIQIRSAIQTGSAHGMMLLEQSLNELVRQGKITKEVALGLADEKKLITAG